MNLRIISIGTMASHPLWNERGEVRTGHATTTLLQSSQKDGPVIIVDPSLPSPALKARLFERTGLQPDSVTHVFVTNLRPELRRGLDLFGHATWWVSEQEREQVGVSLIHEFQRAEEEDETELAQLLSREIEIVRQFKAAPDRLAENVDLFPLPGFTPGHAGLIVGLPRSTVLICGDAVPTTEHLEQGKVLQECIDLKAAQASFLEAIEIADILVPGRDNLVANPTRRPF